jgi:hypothetical protein
VHFVASLGAAQMRQSGAGDQTMGGVGMIERRQQPLLGEQRLIGHGLVGHPRRGHRFERHAPVSGLDRQIVNAFGAREHGEPRSRFLSHAHPLFAVRRFELEQSHANLPRGAHPRL